MDLETVNKELEVAKNEKQNIEDLYSQKNKLQQEINQKKNILQKRRTSLQHDKEQLEEELSNVKDDRIKQQFQNDLDKINKELEIVEIEIQKEQTQVMGRLVINNPNQLIIEGITIENMENTITKQTWENNRTYLEFTATPTN